MYFFYSWYRGPLVTFFFWSLLVTIFHITHMYPLCTLLDLATHNGQLVYDIARDIHPSIVYIVVYTDR